MNISSFIEHPLVSILGWTLVHFVWQAFVVALLFAILLALLNRFSPTIRYGTACVGLGLMVALPIATLVGLASNTEMPAENPSVAETNAANVFEDKPLSATVPPSVASLNPAGVVEFRSSDSSSGTTVFERPKASFPLDVEMLASRIGNYLPFFVAVWLTGVCLLAIRLMFGLGRVSQWERTATPIGNSKIKGVFEKLARRMDCTRVLLKESTSVAVPAVIGWLKPIVLVPTSMISGLTTSELESVLAHELAHVRRYDYLVNLLQTVVEVLLFYHPAVWWISRRIRIEREFCCDDMAVSVCGNRTAIARALARMEEIRCKHEQLIMAANGGSLVARIRRLVTGQPSQTNYWWPAGEIALATIFALAGGLWVSNASAKPGQEAFGDAALTINEPTLDDEEDEEIQTKKSEILKKDSKTDIEQRVFADIKLSNRRGEETHSSVAELKYSNVIMYSFIPARIAKELNAVEIGEIDFGGTAPPRSPMMQSIDLKILGVEPDVPATEEVPDRKTITVAELDGPANRPEILAEYKNAQKPLLETRSQLEELKIRLGPGHAKIVELNERIKRLAESLERIEAKMVKVIPYPDPAIWTPGHLGFYGLNKTKQHRFKIVRISKVDLGVGPSFGPINALVLDDENSDFGLLGRDWTQQVRGENGEGLWFAADGTFHFMAPPKRKKLVAPMPNRVPDNQGIGDSAAINAAKKKLQLATEEFNETERLFRKGSKSKTEYKRAAYSMQIAQLELQAAKSGSLSVESSSSQDDADPRAARPDLKVLNTHDYNLSRRESTGWITVDRTRMPVDHGVERGGITVYLTLMFDIVVVDEDEKVLWQVPWGKGMPMWQTVSIVELEIDGKPTSVVELFAARKKIGQLNYQYHLLESGEKIQDPEETRKRASNDRDALPDIQVSVDDNNSRAFVNSLGKGRTAAEMLKHMSMIVERDPALSGSVTNFESIVTAESGRLIGNIVKAQQVSMSLPEGSQTRAVFQGDTVEINNHDDHVAIRIVNGKLELLGPLGVSRATATADAKAGVLLIECRMANDEVAMVVQTEKLDNEQKPPVKVKMNLETGAPDDEEDPPHGSIRYQIFEESVQEDKPMRMKMKWRYIMKRLAQDAEAETGKKWEQLIFGDDVESDDSPAPQTETSEPEPPWWARGTVTDRDGNPLEGVQVTAHCGIGSLRRTGQVTTGKNGKYELRFGPGGFGGPKLVQAATISVSLAGHTEKNLHRQGDLVAAMEKPDGEIGWGGKTIDDLFLPNEPKQIDFVMIPASSIKGRVFQGDKPQANVKVSLTGDDLPPSSSVVASVQTNDKGEFEINNVPVGFAYQILVKPNERGTPWPGWATPPITFAFGNSGDTHIEYSVDGEPVDFSFQNLYLFINDEPENWKVSKQAAAEKKLELKWDGLASEGIVRAGVATIELD